MSFTSFEVSESYSSGFLDGYTVCLKESNPYKWHSLKDNPNDLPTHENKVLVLEKEETEEGSWDDYIVTRYTRVWNPFTNRLMDDFKQWELPMYHKQGYVVAWKEIEPCEFVNVSV